MHNPRVPEDPDATHVERLWVPASWWLVTAFVVATFWWACAVALPGLWGHLIGVVTGLGAASGLAGFGALRVRAGRHGVQAGSAHLPRSAIGSVEVLSRTHARVLRGPGADASAYLCLRGYVHTAVRLDVTDPDDPRPYWYVATRHPERLAAALTAAGIPRRSRVEPDNEGRL